MDFDFAGLEEEPTIVDEGNQEPTETVEPQLEKPAEADHNHHTEYTEGTPATVVKQPYTPEELGEILRQEDFSSIDTSRLTDEGKAIMKSMQSGLTPKLQEAAELRREMEQLRQEMQAAKPQEQPKDIYEAYDRSPTEVMGTINGEIQRLINEDPVANARSIEELREVKNELVLRDVQKVQTERTQNLEVQRVTQAVFKAVPDLAQKQQALQKFAIEVMGYSPQELAQETNPAVAGDGAVRTIVRINNAYDRFNATATVKQKEVKPQPTEVEKGGAGFEAPQGNYNDVLRNAKKTGDFSQLIYDLPE